MIVYGRNTVLEALKSSYNSNELYLEEGINPDERISEIISLANKRDINIKKSGNKHITKLTRSIEHQGVALDIDFIESRIKDLDLDNDNGFIYISEATFEQNIGAIIRTAECAGLGGVLIPNTIRITPTIAKISTGAVFHIPVVSFSIYQAIKEFKQNGYSIYGIERGGKTYFDQDINTRSLFIIGGEDKSLSDQIRNECDSILEIPQFGKINSLNMSNASSIIIYEYVRQKTKNI